jgi:hypothetical protein
MEFIMKACKACSKCGYSLYNLSYLDAVNFKGEDPRQWWYVCDKCLDKENREWIKRETIERDKETYE